VTATDQTSAKLPAAPAEALQPYVGNTDLFPVLRHWSFFNHAGVAPITAPAAAALRKYSDEAEHGAYLFTSWYAEIQQLRALCAGLINAEPREIAFIKNTSEGLSIVSHGLDWQWGDRIVTTDIEYPANIYPWMEVVRARGAKLVMVKEEIAPDGRRHVPVEKILEEAANPRTRLVSLSHVEFASGQRHDIAKIGALCRSKGKLLCVDAIQSVGVLPVDVKAMQIDYLSADGHKWMLGPEGAGFFYCRGALIERTRPLMIGWMNVINAMAYGSYDYTLRSDAGRFECGTYNVPGLLALKASLEIIRNAGITAVATRVKHLTDHLERGLISRGYGIVSPRAAQQWSGIVSFFSMKHRHEEIVRTLRKEHQVELAVREGRLRASPHFYNTNEQIDRLLELLPRH
jgi:selenocysteine lyase/cysteine desulfurase